MNAAAILNAIRGVIRGELGSGRVMASGAFGEGIAATVERAIGDQARWLQAHVKRRFDVEMEPARRTGSIAPPNANHGILAIEVRVHLIYALSLLSDTSTPEQRYAVRSSALEDANDVMQALTWPGNLFVDGEGTHTGLISASLLSREASPPRIAREDWAAGILQLELRLEGLVHDEQYDPGSEAGWILDLWASAGVDDDDTVLSSWIDGASSLDYAQATETKRPTFLQAGMGGLPSVRFVGANGDVLRRAAPGLVSTSKSYVLITAIDPVSVGALDFVLDIESGRLVFFLGGASGPNVGYFDGAFREIAPATTGPQILRWKLVAGVGGEVWRGNTLLGSAPYAGVDLGGLSAFGGRFDASDAFLDARVSRAFLADTIDDERDARVMGALSSSYNAPL